MNEFYVYAYLDPRKPGNFIYKNKKFKFEPFYIGKAKNDNCFVHLEGVKRGYKNCNLFKHRKIRSILRFGLEPIIIKVQENLIENESLILEINMIKIIGRGKNGPLCNLTDGGEGISGYFHKESTKQIMREKQLGSLNSFFGKTHSHEYKNKLKNQMSGNKLLKGIHCSEKNKRKTSKRMKRNQYRTKEWLIETPDKKKIVVKNLQNFCITNNIPYTSLWEVSTGKRHNCYGYKCKKLN